MLSTYFRLFMNPKYGLVFYVFTLFDVFVDSSYRDLKKKNIF